MPTDLTPSERMSMYCEYTTDQDTTECRRCGRRPPGNSTLRKCTKSRSRPTDLTPAIIARIEAVCTHADGPGWPVSDGATLTTGFDSAFE